MITRIVAWFVELLQSSRFVITDVKEANGAVSGCITIFMLPLNPLGRETMRSLLTEAEEELASRGLTNIQIGKEGGYTAHTISRPFTACRLPIEVTT